MKLREGRFEDDATTPAFSEESWMSVTANAPGDRLVAVASRGTKWIKSE